MLHKESQIGPKGPCHLYYRLKRVISRTTAYYQKHGLRQTISRIYIELTGTGAIHKIESYPPLISEQATSKVRKVSFLIGCPEGESKRYRVYNIIEGLTSKGIECHSFYATNLDKAEQLLNSDILIIFRALMSENVDTIINRFKQRNIPVVFDIDDLIFEPDSIHFVDAINNWPDAAKNEYLDGFKRYREALQRCDFATCATDYLASRIRQTGKPCFVVRNTISKAQYELSEAIFKSDAKRGKKIRIGYFSGTRTRDQDFLEAADAVFDILERYRNTEFHIVGELELPATFNKFGNRIVRKRFMPYLKMLEYLSRIDINVAPLEQNNPYTAGKSELKIFEAGLVRVPTIASRTESYSKCISDGNNGFLAGSKEEWSQKLALLVENEELRTETGINARRDFTNAFYIENVIDDVVKVYEEIIDTYREKSIDLNHMDMAWVIPEPSIGSGGHRNIFRAVRKLSDYGHMLTIYFTGDSDIRYIRDMVNKHFYDLSDIEFIKYDGNLRYHDVCIATMWTTVYPMMRHKQKIKYPFYFVQDYEPMLYPMGIDYILAENTYRMGLTHITSGPWPTKILRDRFNAEADFFRFPIDKKVYNTNIERTKTNKNIVFFARPEMPRRCYELGIMVLRLVKERLPDVEIILFGSEKVHGQSLPFKHTNLGVLNINDLARLYRNADLGIAFSTTNPSLVPYEMMACGLAVADMGLEDSIANYDSEENVYLLNSVPDVMAQQIVDIMNNDEERQRKALNGYNYVQAFPDEEGMGRRIEQLIKRKIAGNYQ